VEKEGSKMNYSSLWVDKPRRIVRKEKELREPEPDEVVVRVKACGICGTDIHFYRDFPNGVLTPLGHEVSGVIHSVGERVQDLEVGTDVVLQNHVPCGTCSSCLNRRPETCENIRTYMNDQAGMGEYLVVPRSMVIAYGDLEYGEATLAEPITVAMDLCKEANVRQGDTVLIMGPGVIGLSCVKLASVRGAAEIAVVGRDVDSVRGRYRRQVAETFGAGMVFDSSDPDWKEQLKRRYPAGFDRVIITSPPKTIADGIELAGFGGWIVYDGISFTDDQLTFSANDFHFSKKRLIASHAIPNWGFPTALRMLTRRQIPPEILLTHRFPVSGVESALEEYSSRDIPIIKTVIDY
jgi:L-iditol 2-dehydrogenase